MHTLNIYFNGMCGFVPRKNHREVTVVLPNLKDLGPKDPMFHQPALVFYRNDIWKSSERCDDFKDYPLLHNELYCGWDLDHEHLEIRFCDDAGGRCRPTPGEEASMRRGTVTHGNSKPQNLGEARDLKWIPSIGAILEDRDGSANKGAIDPDLLKPKVPDEAAEKLSARMELTFGDFECVEIAREPISGQDMHDYEFVKVGAPEEKSHLPPQALAELAKIVIPFPESIRISARPLNDPSGEEHFVTFRRDVDMALINVPLPPKQNPDPSEPRVTGHFRHFFDLLKTPIPPRDRFIPRRIEQGKKAIELAKLPQILRIPGAGDDDMREFHSPESVRNETLCPFVQYP